MQKLIPLSESYDGCPRRILDNARPSCYTFGMNSTIERLRNEARTLSTDERELLLAAIDFDLRGETLLTESEAAVTEAAWDAEIEKRVDDIKSGKIPLLTSEEFFSVFDEARAAIKSEAFNR
ncbi:MAG: addiction module protein [Verrucomicrobiota bacterium]